MILENFFALVKKDLLMFFRSRVSSAIIIIVPLIIILAAGYAFSSTSLSNVYVGVHVNSSSNLTQKIISGFTQNGFMVKDYPSASDCINEVELNNVQICAVFSNGTSDNSSRDSVVFYVDYSRLNLAGTLVNNAENSVYSESAKEGKLSVQSLLNLINLTKTSLPSMKVDIDSASLQVDKNQNIAGGISVETSEFDVAITYLKGAMGVINNTAALSDVNNTINLLTSLKSSNENVSVNLGSLISSESGVSVNLHSALSKLNSLIVSVNSSNVSNAESVVSPMEISVEPLNKSLGNSNYMVPVLIALIALFGSLLLSSAFVLKEKKTKAYFRNFMTPSKDPVFILSTYVTCLIILLIQFILIFAGIYLILGINIFSQPLELAVVLLAALTAFIFIGMFIGYVFRSEESVIFASMITAGIFLFFSNTLFPIESISGTLMNLSIMNPLIALDSALKKVILFGLDFQSITTEIVIFAVFFVVFALLTYFARKITRRML